MYKENLIFFGINGMNRPNVNRPSLKLKVIVSIIISLNHIDEAIINYLLSRFINLLLSASGSIFYCQTFFIDIVNRTVAISYRFRTDLIDHNTSLK